MNEFFGISRPNLEIITAPVPEQPTEQEWHRELRRANLIRFMESAESKANADLQRRVAERRVAE
jgi:hypothetical protein